MEASSKVMHGFGTPRPEIVISTLFRHASASSSPVQSRSRAEGGAREKEKGGTKNIRENHIIDPAELRPEQDER